MFKSHASQTNTEVMLHEDCSAKIPLFGGVVKCLCTWVVVNFFNCLSLSLSLSLCAIREAFNCSWVHTPHMKTRRVQNSSSEPDRWCIHVEELFNYNFFPIACQIDFSNRIHSRSYLELLLHTSYFLTCRLPQMNESRYILCHYCSE